VVAPKRAALADANRRLEGANKKLSAIRARVKELRDKVEALEQSLMQVGGRVVGGWVGGQGGRAGPWRLAG
jgi:predicted  nucleic acid-binding Zn-ribbon protein